MADTVADVVVVGGGIAGLAAALNVLRRRPLAHIVIIDADGRIGGRACSAAFADHTVDLGAAWVHGDVPGSFRALEGYPVAREEGTAPDRQNPWIHPGADIASFPAVASAPPCSVHGSASNDECVRLGLRAFQEARVACADGCSSGSAHDALTAALDARRAAGGLCEHAESVFRWCAVALGVWFGAAVEQLDPEDVASDSLGDYPGPHRLPAAGDYTLPVAADGAAAAAAAGGVSPVVVLPHKGGIGRLVGALWGDIVEAAAVAPALAPGSGAAAGGAAAAASTTGAAAASTAAPAGSTVDAAAVAARLLRLRYAVTGIDWRPQEDGRVVVTAQRRRPTTASSADALPSGLPAQGGVRLPIVAAPAAGDAPTVGTPSMTTVGGSSAVDGSGAETITFRARCVVSTLPHNILLAASADTSASPPAGCMPVPVLTPAMPAHKARALSRIMMGSYKKVLLAFAAPPLPRGTKFMVALTTNKSTGSDGGAVALPLPVVSIVENYAAVKGDAVPVLVGCFCGEDARRPLDAGGATTSTPFWTLEECVASVMAALRAHFPGHTIPDPINAATTTWEACDLSGRGAYSFVPYAHHDAAASADSEEGDEEEDLQAALVEPLVQQAWVPPTTDGTAAAGGAPASAPATGRVFFAGEAIDLEHMGSLHAALSTGRRAAADALRHLQAV